MRMLTYLTDLTIYEKLEQFIAPVSKFKSAVPHVHRATTHTHSHSGAVFGHTLPRDPTLCPKPAEKMEIATFGKSRLTAILELKIYRINSFDIFRLHKFKL